MHFYLRWISERIDLEKPAVLSEKILRNEHLESVRLHLHFFF